MIIFVNHENLLLFNKLNVTNGVRTLKGVVVVLDKWAFSENFS